MHTHIKYTHAYTHARLQVHAVCFQLLLHPGPYLPPLLGGTGQALYVEQVAQVSFFPGLTPAPGYSLGVIITVLVA